MVAAHVANADLCCALIEVLHQIAAQCDGVRCDMAMLMVKDVFNQTWGALAGEMRAEFWDVAIAEVKKIAPEFLFMAEAYWETEWHLQQLGFDFAYDKRLYDLVLPSDHVSAAEQGRVYGAHQSRDRFGFHISDRVQNERIRMQTAMTRSGDIAVARVTPLTTILHECLGGSSGTRAEEVLSV